MRDRRLHPGTPGRFVNEFAGVDYVLLRKLEANLNVRRLPRVDDLPARSQAETPENRAHVTLHGVLADLQCERDLAIARAAPNQMRDLLLAFGQHESGGPPRLQRDRRRLPAWTSSSIASFVQRRKPIALNARAASPAWSIELDRSPHRTSRYARARERERFSRRDPAQRPRGALRRRSALRRDRRIARRP